MMTIDIPAPVWLFDGKVKWNGNLGAITSFDAKYGEPTEDTAFAVTMTLKFNRPPYVKAPPKFSHYIYSTIKT